MASPATVDFRATAGAQEGMAFLRKHGFNQSIEFSIRPVSTAVSCEDRSTNNTLFSEAGSQSLLILRWPEQRTARS